MKILVENLQNKVVVNKDLIQLIHKAIKYSCEACEFITPCSVSVLLVNNNEIRRLNNEFRNIDKYTDVLSFPMVEIKEGEVITEEQDYDLDEGLLLLGDIFISVERAIDQADEYGHSFEREIAFLACHGLLHLLGFDHTNQESEEKMFSIQDQVMSRLKLTRS